MVLDVEVNLSEIQTAFGLTMMCGSIFSKKPRTHPASEKDMETSVPQAGSGDK